MIGGLSRHRDGRLNWTEQILLLTRTLHPLASNYQIMIWWYPEKNTVCNMHVQIHLAVLFIADWLNEWMNEWMSVWMNRWMNEWWLKIRLRRIVIFSHMNLWFWWFFHTSMGKWQTTINITHNCMPDCSI